MSCGLGNLVPYFECQYPQVVNDNAIVLNSGGNNGVGDYVDPFAFPIPQHLMPGNNRGLGCDCGGACCGGMGTYPITAPDGYFSSGLDFTEWGMAEWLTTLAGFWMLFSTAWTTKSAVSYASAGRKRSQTRRKRIEAATKARGFF